MCKRPKVYGPGDAARFLGISAQYFLSLVEKGKVPYQTISYGRIFFEPDLVKLKNERIMKSRNGDRRIKLNTKKKKPESQK